MDSFETGDLRWSNWIDSLVISGVTYYYPYKYKSSSNSGQGYSPPYVEYQMVLRLAEVYLIRAEAEANSGNGNISAAISDLNTIRTRAGLPNYAGSFDAASVIGAVLKERETEMFAEWGNRWLDLKRTNLANNTLGTISYKMPWSSDALVYPIPYSELTTNPNLNQNPGY